MEPSKHEAGKIDATEQIVSLIYDRYLYCRTFHGKDSEMALLVKNLIHAIRDWQADDLGQ